MKKLLRSTASVLYNLFTNQRTLTRSQFLDNIHYKGEALEIGPFTNPHLRGPKVRYFDVLDKEGLLARSKVENYPVDDPNNVPEMDYVSPTGDLSVITDTFEVIYSSHCIEHQPDLIAHLNQIERLLEPGGRYYLTVPDKRYCFDALIVESDLALVIEAHYHQSQVHSLANVIRYYALTTHNSALRHWLSRHGPSDGVVERTKTALAAYEKANGEYIDVHGWRFTPHGFVRLLNQLKGLEYIGLSVERLHPTSPGTHEFYVVLSKDAE